ncbi:MAG: 4Fe-4S dicluster domain-containing protein [Clostridiales bacterium]|nr:4Fe-4S dicluster domain-containing protein [Clostridiales bacterium]
MKTVCEINKCVGCMACVDSCPKGAISINDDLKSYNAVIDAEKCCDCGLCFKTCQNNVSLSLNLPFMWKQGYVSSDEDRKTSSSGGVAYALSKSFIENGGVVCSCVFRDGEFVFDCSDNLSDITKFKGSKYVKSNPSGVYKSIKALLKDNKSVLFIGLPCQVSALKIVVGESLNKNLYTVDLICHGTPSPKLLESFVNQYGYKLSDLSGISFRKKGRFALQSEKTFVRQGVMDRYSIAFLNGLNYTENCYNCNYAKEERVGDLTIGDSWGSDLPSDQKSKGVSLLLCQTEKGKKLIDDSDLVLFDVDKTVAKNHNHQLEYPTKKPPHREKFFRLYSKKTFNKAVFSCYPKLCFKQSLKSLLIGLGVKKYGGGVHCKRSSQK